MTHFERLLVIIAAVFAVLHAIAAAVITAGVFKTSPVICIVATLCTLVVDFILCVLWFNILFIIVAFISAMLVDKKKEVTKPSKYYKFLARSICSIILFFSNAKVEVEGIEKIPEGQRFLMVANHLSNYDPISLIHAIGPREVVFVSKPQNFDIHMIGRIIHKAGFMAIDRDNVKNAIVTINKSAEYIKNDVTSVFIFPEGTRNRTENPLCDFRNGAFKIALKAKCPLVIAGLVDTETVKKNAPWKRTVIKVKILETIPAEKVASMRTNEISDYAYKLIYDNIEHNK